MNRYWVASLCWAFSALVYAALSTVFHRSSHEFFVVIFGFICGLFTGLNVAAALINGKRSR